MGKRVSLILGFLTLLTVGSVESGVVPGRWEKLNSQPVGTQLLVTLRSGETIHCVFKGMTSDKLIVQDPVSGVLELSKVSLSRVTSWENRDDGKADGVAIGTGLGILLGALTAGEVEVAGGSGAASIVSSAGLGGFIGYLVDKAHTRPEVLYTASK